jgi:hypothetical protein
MSNKSCTNCAYLLSDKKRNLNCCNAFHELADVENINSHNCGEWKEKEADLLTAPRRTPDEENRFRRIRDEWWGGTVRIARSCDSSFRDEYMIKPQANLPRTDEFPLMPKGFCRFIADSVERQSNEIRSRFNVEPRYALMNPRTYDHYRRELPFERDGQAIEGIPIVVSPRIPDDRVEVVASMDSRKARPPVPNPLRIRRPYL